MKKICRGNPSETFDTEQSWDYSIPWTEKDKEKVETYHQEKVVNEKVEVKVGK